MGIINHIKHYVNAYAIYTAILLAVEIDLFPLEECDIFLIFAQNIHFGYMLEPF